MTDPPTVSQHTFYRINQDGGQDISLHENPMATSPPQFPTLSPDGTYLAFMISDTSGGVLKTDGSGFIKEVSGELLPWSISSGKINQNVPPLWQKDSSRFYIAIKDDPLGEIKQVTIDNNQASSPQVLEWDSGTSTYVLVTHGGFYGVSPESMALTSDETLMATISSNPKGIFIIPLLGPAGARTRADIAGIGVGEIPDSRWLGQ